MSSELQRADGAGRRSAAARERSVCAPALTESQLSHLRAASKLSAAQRLAMIDRLCLEMTALARRARRVS
jgi:hypothetical protein